MYCSDTCTVQHSTLLPKRYISLKNYPNLRVVIRDPIKSLAVYLLQLRSHFAPSASAVPKTMPLVTKLSSVTPQSLHCFRWLRSLTNPYFIQSRSFSTGGKRDDDSSKSKHDQTPQNEDDTAFGLDGFLHNVDIEEEDSTNVTIEDLTDSEDVTPELASDLVSRMVSASARSFAERNSIDGQILNAITPHTVSVLRASRICTNQVFAASSETYVYPIEKRVTAELLPERLNLSAPALEALRILSGPRDHGDYIKLSFDRYPTKEENRAFIVTKLDRLVSAAKLAVGDTVNTTPLNSWEEVTQEVQRQAVEELAEAGSLEKVLGQPEDRAEARA